jgi:hypothetical protein
LVADSVGELNGFAEDIGLKPEWFQGDKFPHYDLTPRMRLEAIRAGAVEIDRKQLFALIRRLREQVQNDYEGFEA